MKRIALGITTILFLSGCAATSQSLAPLWQICQGVKYLEDRSYTIQDDDLSNVFSPLVNNAKKLDPNSDESKEMSKYLKGAFEIGRLTKEANITIESFRYSSRPIQDLAAESKKLSDELAKSRFPEQIDNLCSRISKKLTNRDSVKDLSIKLQGKLDAYIKSVQEGPYEVEFARAQAEGEMARSGHISKYGNDMSRRITFCTETALPKYMSEFNKRGGYAFRPAQIDNISNNFIFWCYGNP